MYHRRHLEVSLAGPVSRNKIRLLFGARQTGKTRLLRSLLDDATARFFDLTIARLRTGSST